MVCTTWFSGDCLHVSVIGMPTYQPARIPWEKRCWETTKLSMEVEFAGKTTSFSWWIFQLYLWVSNFRVSTRLTTNWLFFVDVSGFQDWDFFHEGPKFGHLQKQFGPKFLTGLIKQLIHRGCWFLMTPKHTALFGWEAPSFCFVMSAPSMFWHG